jgi:hypothetical protein
MISYSKNYHGSGERRLYVLTDFEKIYDVRAMFESEMWEKRRDCANNSRDGGNKNWFSVDDVIGRLPVHIQKEED